MILSKKNLLMLALLCVLNVVLIISFLYKEGDNHKKEFTKKLISAWTESDAFLDDVYTFNVQGITDSLTRLLSVYDGRNYKNVCVLLNLNSFSGGANEIREECTNDITVSSMINESSSHPIHIFDIPLNIGNKNLGSIKIYESHYRQNNLLVFNILFFVSCFCITFFAIYYLLKFHISKKEKESLVMGLRDDTNKYERQLAALVKVIANNKQHFALNEDIVFVTYEHPYSNLFYKNGNTLSIRCSLLDLESLFFVDFIRLNKSTVVNKIFLKQEDTIFFHRNHSSVSIKIKKKDFEVNISPVFKENLFDKDF